MPDPLLSSIIFILLRLSDCQHYSFLFLLYTRKSYWARVYVGHKHTDTFIFLRHLHSHQCKNLVNNCMLFGIFAVVVDSRTAVHDGCFMLGLLVWIELRPVNSSRSSASLEYNSSCSCKSYMQAPVSGKNPLLTRTGIYWNYQFYWIHQYAGPLILLPGALLIKYNE